MLMGEQEDSVFAYSNNSYGGNKILFVSGTFKAYGIPRFKGNGGGNSRSLIEEGGFLDENGKI